MHDAGNGNVIAGNSIGLDANGAMNHVQLHRHRCREQPRHGDRRTAPSRRDRQLHRYGNVIVGGHGDVGVFVGAGVGRHVIAGNFIGTDRDGSTGLGNDGGGASYSARPGSQIGPGNTISGNQSDGRRSPRPHHQRSSRNSIHYNGERRASTSQAGANDDLPAPSITDAVSSVDTASGHARPGNRQQEVFLEFFRSPHSTRTTAARAILGSVTHCRRGNRAGAVNIFGPDRSGGGVSRRP